MSNIEHNPDSTGQLLVDKVEALPTEETPVSKKPLVWKPYPVEVFPKPVRRFIEQGAKAMQIDPVFMALPVVVTSASAIGNSRKVRLRKSWDEPSILWGAIIGKSGAGKSPPLDKVVSPICRKQSDEFLRAQEEERDALETGESENSPRPAMRFIVNDITIEALADRLRDAPRGLLVFRDELAGWVQSFGQYKNTSGGDMQSWLCLHTGTSLTIDRKTGDHRTIHVPQAAAYVLGGIQPGILQRCFTGKHFDSGLLARILMVYPPSKTRRWQETDLETETETAWDDIVSQLLALEPIEDTSTDTVSSGIVELNADARALFVEYYDRNNKELGWLDCEGERAFFAKLEGGAGRLALVLHYLRWASGEYVDPLILDRESMRRGIVLADWHKNETRRIYQRLYGNAVEQDRQTLIDWISSHDGTCTARDLRNGCKSRYPTVADAGVALETLHKARLGTWETHQNPRGGPASNVFCLNSGGVQ